MTSIVTLDLGSTNSVGCHYRIGCCRSLFLVFPFEFVRSYVSYFLVVTLRLEVLESAAVQVVPYH